MVDRQRDLEGKRVLVTAGPTQEAIDPVRFISNHSTGRMGYAIAEVARDRGARVVLVSGPVSLEAPEGVELVSIVSAQRFLRCRKRPLRRVRRGCRRRRGCRLSSENGGRQQDEEEGWRLVHRA